MRSGWWRLGPLSVVRRCAILCGLPLVLSQTVSSGYDADPGGVLIRSVGPVSVDVTNGLYEADLPFMASDFGAPNRYVEVSVNGQTLAPRLRLASAPFAYITQSLNGFGSDDFVKKTGGMMTGTLQVAGAILSTSGGFTFPDGTVQTAAGGVVLPVGAALQCPDGTVGLSGRTPLQIATLHWYDVRTQTTFPVGSGPIGVAFDGANIWVASFLSNTLSKL
jgi:hypothetical protein